MASLTAENRGDSFKCKTNDKNRWQAKKYWTKNMTKLSEEVELGRPRCRKRFTKQSTSDWTTCSSFWLKDDITFVALKQLSDTGRLTRKCTLKIVVEECFCTYCRLPGHFDSHCSLSYTLSLYTNFKRHNWARRPTDLLVVYILYLNSYIVCVKSCRYVVVFWPRQWGPRRSI